MATDTHQQATNKKLEKRLDALVVLVAGILRLMMTDKKPGQISALKKKVAALLISGGIPKNDAAKIVGIDIHNISGNRKKQSHEGSRTT